MRVRFEVNLLPDVKLSEDREKRYQQVGQAVVDGLKILQGWTSGSIEDRPAGVFVLVIPRGGQ